MLTFLTPNKVATLVASKMCFWTCVVDVAVLQSIVGLQKGCVQPREPRLQLHSLALCLAHLPLPLDVTSFS